VNDEDLIGRFHARDETAVREAGARYAAYCLAIARNVLPDRRDAEECLSDALLAAWNSIPPARPANLKTYLGKLIRDAAVDRWRKNHAAKRDAPAIVPLEELEELLGEEEIDAALEEAELSRRISAFLRTRREAERNVFLRRYWYYDSIEQICARWGYKKSRVTMMLKRTRDALAEFLKKEGYFL